MLYPIALETVFFSSPMEEALVAFGTLSRCLLNCLLPLQLGLAHSSPSIFPIWDRVPKKIF